MSNRNRSFADRLDRQVGKISSSQVGALSPDLRGSVATMQTSIDRWDAFTSRVAAPDSWQGRFAAVSGSSRVSVTFELPGQRQFSANVSLDALRRDGALAVLRSFNAAQQRAGTGMSVRLSDLDGALWYVEIDRGRLYE